MTDKEKLAEEWANKRCPKSGPEFVVWQMCKEDYLAGYDQGAADANKWWAGRWGVYRTGTWGFPDHKERQCADIVEEEMDAREAEVLG